MSSTHGTPIDDGNRQTDGKATVTDQTLAALVIPDEYEDDFVSAIVHEIGHDAEAVHGARHALAQANETRRSDHAAMCAEDLANAVALLASDARLLCEIQDAGPGKLIVHADADTLAHVCKALAAKIVAPRLTDELGCDPLDADAARELLDRLAWATNRTIDLQTDTGRPTA